MQGPTRRCFRQLKPNESVFRVTLKGRQNRGIIGVVAQNDFEATDLGHHLRHARWEDPGPCRLDAGDATQNETGDEEPYERETYSPAKRETIVIPIEKNTLHNHSITIDSPSPWTQSSKHASLRTTNLSNTRLLHIREDYQDEYKAYLYKTLNTYSSKVRGLAEASSELS